MLFSEQGFLDQFPLGEYREAIRAFVEELQTSGYLVEQNPNGASIRKRMPGRKRPVTVGWIAPPCVKMRPGARDITLGTWTKYNNLENQLAALTSHLGPYATMAKDASGVHLTPQLFMEKQQDVINLLRHLAEMIDRPAEEEPPKNQCPSDENTRSVPPTGTTNRSDPRCPA